MGGRRARCPLCRGRCGRRSSLWECIDLSVINQASGRLSAACHYRRGNSWRGRPRGVGRARRCLFISARSVLFWSCFGFHVFWFCHFFYLLVVLSFLSFVIFLPSLSSVGNVSLDLSSLAAPFPRYPSLLHSLLLSSLFFSLPLPLVAVDVVIVNSF